MTVISSVAMEKNAFQHSFLVWVVFFLGFSTFLPVGSAYLSLIVLLPILLLRFKLALFNMDKSWLLMIALILVWPILTLPFNYNENFWSRYEHSFRFALCIIIALSLKYNEKIYLLKGFVLGGVFASSVILIHNVILALPEWNLWHQLLSVKGNASSQKWIMLAMMPAILLVFSLEKNRKLHKNLILLCAFLIFNVVAYYSISRNSHIILVACLLVFVAYFYRYFKYWLFAALSVAMLSIFSIQLFESIGGRFGQLVTELNVYMNSGDFNSSVGVRAHMYMTAWNTMLENWVLGSGLGSWEKLWFEASRAHPNVSGINNPHNDFLLFGMENGIVGLLTILLFFIKIFIASWRNNNNIAGLGWIIGWGLMITALVNAPFRDGALGMMMIIFAVAFSESQRKDDELYIAQ
jgi:O-antigen ligase